MKQPFSSWRAGLPFYAPTLLLGILLSVLLYNTPYVWAGLGIIVIGVCMALFFRDFPREITAQDHEIVAPADGTIVGIEDLEESPHYDGPCRRISIFLSIFDVHLNRAPYPGAVTALRYKEGLFKDARKPETTEVNESNAVWMDTPRGAMTVRQISGAVARRIVCPLEVGTKLKKGEKFGMIRFGSRTELYLPPGTQVTVQLKDKVKAGSSIVAAFEADTRA